MADNQSSMEGLALALGLTSRGVILDGYLVTCDDTVWQQMVLLLMCTVIHYVLPTVKMPFAVWFCHGI
jgi:hypothetical protein